MATARACHLEWSELRGDGQIPCWRRKVFVVVRLSGASSGSPRLASGGADVREGKGERQRAGGCVHMALISFINLTF